MGSSEPTSGTTDENQIPDNAPSPPPRSDSESRVLSDPGSEVDKDEGVARWLVGVSDARNLSDLSDFCR